MLQEIKGSGNVAIFLRKERHLKRIRKIGICIILVLAILGNSARVEASTSVKTERKMKIVEVCRNNYCIYGVYPSVCLAQAILESSLGDVCRPNNYWGLNQGKTCYASLEDGVIAYLECINYRDQLYSIATGGYCGSNWFWYWETCVQIIEENALWVYDQNLPAISAIHVERK